MWLYRRGLQPKCPHVSPTPDGQSCSLQCGHMTNTTCQDLQVRVTVMGHVSIQSECWGHRLWVSGSGGVGQNTALSPGG